MVYSYRYSSHLHLFIDIPTSLHIKLSFPSDLISQICEFSNGKFSNENTLLVHTYVHTYIPNLYLHILRTSNLKASIIKKVQENNEESHNGHLFSSHLPDPQPKCIFCLKNCVRISLFRQRIFTNQCRIMIQQNN